MSLALISAIFVATSPLPLCLIQSCSATQRLASGLQLCAKDVLDYWLQGRTGEGLPMGIPPSLNPQPPSPTLLLSLRRPCPRGIARAWESKTAFTSLATRTNRPFCLGSPETRLFPLDDQFSPRDPQKVNTVAYGGHSAVMVFYFWQPPLNIKYRPAACKSATNIKTTDSIIRLLRPFHRIPIIS